MNRVRVPPCAPLGVPTQRSVSVSTLLAALLVLPLIVKVSFAQTASDVFSFTNGAPEVVTAAQGRGGNLYGTNGCGTGTSGFVFAVTVAGVLTDLHDFDSASGDCPNAGLMLAGDGNFYGTTLGGGSGDGLNGVLFRITPKGEYTVLHFYAGGADGSRPSAAPIEASNGAFYGTTKGDDTGSTVYKYTTAGGLTTLYQFDGTKGQTVVAPLIQGADGKLYGTADSGGTNGCGTVFQMSTAGKLLKSYSFLCGLSGAHPDAPLVQAADGNFYGTASAAGRGGGTIFKMGSDLRPSVLYFFGAAGPHDGRTPLGGLVQATDGNLYGTTLKGASARFGTLVQISPC